MFYCTFDCTLKNKARSSRKPCIHPADRIIGNGSQSHTASIKLYVSIPTWQYVHVKLSIKSSISPTICNKLSLDRSESPTTRNQRSVNGSIRPTASDKLSINGFIFPTASDKLSVNGSILSTASDKLSVNASVLYQLLIATNYL